MVEAENNIGNAVQLELFVEPNTPVYYRKKNGELGQFDVHNDCADEAIEVAKEHLQSQGEEYSGAVLAVVKGVPTCLAMD